MVFLPRKLMAAAVLAALSLPGWAQSEAAAPAAAPAAMSVPAAQAATPAARPMARAPRYQQQRHRHHMRGQQRLGGQAAADWQERRAQHHAQLKEQLQLSPAQDAAWTEFTTAVEHTPSHARLGWEGMEQLTTPERIDRMRALRIQYAAEADRRGDAVKAFYAQLNPAQQKTFDAHHGPHRGMHRPMMGAGPGAQTMMPAPGDGKAQPGWQPQDCPMMDGGSGPRDGRGPRGGRNAPMAQ